MFWWMKIKFIINENYWMTKKKWEYNITMELTKVVHDGWRYMKLVQNCVMLQALIFSSAEHVGFTIVLLVDYPQNIE
jgi:hypothetical protein